MSFPEWIVPLFRRVLFQGEADSILFTIYMILMFLDGQMVLFVWNFLWQGICNQLNISYRCRISHSTTIQLENLIWKLMRLREHHLPELHLLGTSTYFVEKYLVYVYLCVIFSCRCRSLQLIRGKYLFPIWSPPYAGMLHFSSQASDIVITLIRGLVWNRSQRPFYFPNRTQW